MGWGVGIVLRAISGVAVWARAVALGRGFYGPNVWPGRGLSRWVKNKMAGTAEGGFWGLTTGRVCVGAGFGLDSGACQPLIHRPERP